MTKDLTQGSPMRLILAFMFPVLVGYLFQQFYTVTDTIIVAKCLGVQALAAVGATGSVNFLIIGFCMGLTSGFSIPVSQRFGAKDESGLRQYLYNIIPLCLLFAAVFTTLTAIFCQHIFQAMLTPEDIIDGAVAYMRILFLGIPFTILYNMVSAILRALGDSKTPVYFLLLSSVLNIFLDLFLILVIPMGVAGASLATVISQAIAGFISLFYMIGHYPILRMQPSERKVQMSKWSVLLYNGVPMGLQYSITAIGSVILQTSVNTLGSEAVACVTAGNRIGMFFCCPYDAMGTTMATYGGQNTGAGDIPRLRKGLLSCCFIGLCYSVVAFVVLFLFGGKLSTLFVDPSQEALIRNAHLFLTIQSSFYFPLALVNIIRFMIQGMGFGVFAILSGVFEMVARAFDGIVLVPLWGYVAACFASPFAWILADCFLIPAVLHCFRRLQKMLETHAARTGEQPPMLSPRP